MKPRVLKKLFCSGSTCWLPLQHPKGKFNEKPLFFPTKEWCQNFKIEACRWN